MAMKYVCSEFMNIALLIDCCCYVRVVVQLCLICLMCSSHYADNLDGCGLNLESKVRRAYYALVRRCLDGVKSQASSQRSAIHS